MAFTFPSVDAMPRNIALDDANSITLLKAIEATQDFESLVGDMMSEGDEGSDYADAIDNDNEDEYSVEPDSPTAASVFSDLFDTGDTRSECSDGTHLTVPDSGPASLCGTPLHTPFGSPKVRPLL